MKALTYVEHGKFALIEKPMPKLIDSRDAIVRVTLGSICTSDLHIKHGSVPRAVPGITVGHEMVGIVEAVGSAVSTVKPGDRVTVNNHLRNSPGSRQGCILENLILCLLHIIFEKKNLYFPDLSPYRMCAYWAHYKKGLSH